MIRVCILTEPQEILKKILEGLGFKCEIGEEHIKDCDVVVSDKIVDADVPVIVYFKQKDLANQIIKAVVDKQFTPLNNSVSQALEQVRDKSNESNERPELHPKRDVQAKD